MTSVARNYTETLQIYSGIPVIKGYMNNKKTTSCHLFKRQNWTMKAEDRDAPESESEMACSAELHADCGATLGNNIQN